MLLSRNLRSLRSRELGRQPMNAVSIHTLNKGMGCPL